MRRFFFRMPVAQPGSRSTRQILASAGGDNFAQAFLAGTAGRSCFKSSRGGRSGAVASTTWRQGGGAPAHPIHRPREREDRNAGTGSARWKRAGGCFSPNRGGARRVFNCGSADVDGRSDAIAFPKQANPHGWRLVGGMRRSRTRGGVVRMGRAIGLSSLLANGASDVGGSSNPEWAVMARPTRVSGVLRFDWYLDSRRAIYTRKQARMGESRSSRPTSIRARERLPAEGERHGD